eukprot:12052266-Karenia_brevis.AAC.1
MVSITVKQIMSEMIPHLPKSQQDESKTVDGEPNQFRMWLFNFKVCLGQIDSKLAEEVSNVLSREDKSRFP